MTYFPIPVEEFGGLDLINDPGEVGFSGAIDLLNVDFDRHGKVRTRDGYTSWATPSFPVNLLAHRRTSSTRQVVAAANADRFIAYDNTGAIVATQLTASAFANASGYGGMVNFGSQAAEYVYAADGADTLYRWDGTTWTGPIANTPKATLLAVQSPDNRVVASGFYGTTGGPTGGAGTSSPSHIYFSDATTLSTFGAETWGTNNFIEITPGDGERITAMVSWRELLFVFKQSKFAVFYGNTKDSQDNPVFNWRPIALDSEMTGLPGVACAAPEGVYFLTRTGVFLTTGGPPVRVSRPIDPFFTQRTSSFWSGGTFSQDSTAAGQAMTYYQGRLYVSVLVSGGGRVLVYDPANGAWGIYQIAAGVVSGFTPFVDSSGVACLLASASVTGGAASLLKFSPAATDDNGVAITSRYQSGFESMSPPRRYIDRYGFGPSRKRVRSWRVMGTGAVTMAVAADFGSLVGSTALTLGTSPAVAEARYSRAIRGSKISYKLSGTSPWAVNDLVGMLADTRESASDVSD